MIEFIQLDNENFKDFGSENSLDIIWPLEKINIFIGGNNSGKSRFVRAIHSNLDFLKDKNISISQYFNDTTYLNNFSYLVKHFPYKEFLLDFDSGTKKNIDALIHFNDKFKDLTAQNFSNFPFKAQEAFDRTKRFISGLGNKSRIANNNKEKFDSYYIPVPRGLKPLFKQGDGYSYDNIYKDRVVYDYGGKINVYTGLEIFEDIKSKLLGTEQERSIINQFEKFLAEKIFGESVTLIPKYKEDVLNIKIGEEEQRSIVHLGDGIQSMILILYPVFIKKDDLCYFFIEEPETHLHPNFQKLLIQLLYEIGDKHQFFITTHSNSFLNSNISNLFEVKKENKTIVKHVGTDIGKLEVLARLGYNASDLLQTNFIIWVEGPSDRVYLQYLISKYDSTLQENIHYSIMFYGGSTGKYLFDRELDKSLILSLNRNCAYICDSDRDSVRCRSTKYIETTKLVNRLNLGGVFAWMTPYREFENHINADLFVEAVRSVIDEKSATLVHDGKFSDRFEVQVVNNNKQPTKSIRLTEVLLNQIKRAKNKVDNIPDDIIKQELQKSINFTVGTDTRSVNRKVDVAEYVVAKGFEPDKHLKSFIKNLVTRIKHVNNLV